MAAVIRSSFLPVLTALKQQLVNQTVVPSQRVKLVVREQEPHFQGDTDLLVSVSGPTPESTITDSVGRFDLELVRTVTVRIRVRLATDPSDADDALLTDPQYGIIPLEETVLNALVGFWPEDGNGNALLREPIHCSPSQPPRADPLPDRGWAESSLSFDVRYSASVDQSLPS